MKKDLLVNDPVKKDDNNDFIVGQIEQKLKDLEKKKKSESENNEMKKEYELLENHIKNAMQMQIISMNLATQYRERLKKVKNSDLDSQEKSSFFKLDELPGMIEERRQRKRLEKQNIVDPDGKGKQEDNKDKQKG